MWSLSLDNESGHCDHGEANTGRVMVIGGFYSYSVHRRTESENPIGMSQSVYVATNTEMNDHYCKSGVMQCIRKHHAEQIR